MKHRLFVLLLSLFPAFLGSVLAGEQHPNVVLIFADDLGYGDLGCYGATKLKTPNIDKLAADGRRFTDAHSSSAVCTPSRYGLLTGEYPFRANGGKGLWGPAPITSPLLIDKETPTIADVFKKSGYDTAVFGKWHLGFGEGKNDWKEPLRPGPLDLGFDHYFGMPVVNSAPPYVYVENDKIVGSDSDDPLVHVGGSAKKVTPITPIPREAAQRSPNQFTGAAEAHKLFNDFEVGTKLNEKATEWIKSRGEKPFFAYFSTTNVHHPFTPAKRFQGTSEAGWYGDFVHELDWIVGEVMKSLEESGVADNTLVLFTSDNGGMFNHGGREAAKLGHKINGDLLGSKFGIWEGGHRVPFIAWWPGKIEAGSVSDQLLCSVDLMASFAALTGQDLEDQKDSINMLPALTGNPDKPLRTEMFMTPNKPSHMALRRGKWMFIPAKSDGGFRGSQPGQHAWGGAAVTTLVGTPNSDIENGKINADAPPAQLYDLEADVNQTKNLYYENPEVVQEMAAAIKRARQEAGPGAENPPEPQAAAPARDLGPPLSKYDDFEPVGNLRYSFETGTLDGWKITEGALGQAVTKLPSLTRRKDAPFARHGSHHLSTLVPGDGKPLADTQTGVVQSPPFTLTGDKAAFLVSGGYDEKDLHVALVDADSGDVLKKSGGSRDHRMRRVEWDVSKWKGNTVRFEVVDRASGGWGHLNVDDFSAQGDPISVPSKPEEKKALQEISWQLKAS
ncbi:MAG: arylsulfatase A [Verrucomicrobiales bacterium]|jgi:arylsulfatase A